MWDSEAIGVGRALTLLFVALLWGVHPSCRQTRNGDSQSHHESHDGCFRPRYSKGKAVSGTSGHSAPKEGVQILKFRCEAVHVRRRHNHLGLDLEPVVQAHQGRRCGAAAPPHAYGGPPILKTVRYTLGPHDRTRVDKEGRGGSIS